ncbi:MAG TPA: hypothetical protein VNU44_13780 [Bryobacteraceae bacterium]|jgi:hypothetical protein|nr:hypothetical protein [Bryobacteraceae bacterium]
MRLALVCLLSSTVLGQFAKVTTKIDGDTLSVTFADPRRYVGTIWPSFSGEQEIQTVRMLPDRRLEMHASGQKIWRDSHGRTRTEREIGPANYPGVHGVFILTEITDPVMGLYYVLDDQNRIVHRLILSESLMKEAVPATPRKVRMGCGLQNAMQDPRTARRCVERDFAAQNIEGVIASGWRRYDPVADSDDARPLIVTDEEWYSEELWMTVLSVHSDPREGETIMRWTHMSREEPELSMFAPPEGYRVVDEKDSFTLTLKGAIR